MSYYLKFVFASIIRVKTFFALKLPKILGLGLLYKEKCGGCNAT